MKNIVIFAAIAVLLLSACTSRSGRKKDRETTIVEKVKVLTIDSCQYDRAGDVLYFSGGEIAVKQHDSYIVVGGDTVNNGSTIKTIKDVLAKKWPVPESYASGSLRQFKSVIEKTPLDSIFVEKFDGSENYYFYLRSYKVWIRVEGFVRFESRGEIRISTVDVFGEDVDVFGSNGFTKWSQDQQGEILQLLLAKKDKSNLKPVREDRHFVFYK
jgi:hypothetical protein